MQINPRSNLTFGGLTPAPATDPAADLPQELALAEVQSATSFTPTPALAGLLANLGQVPAVRAEVIQQVSARLAKGELLTPVAALQTAQAILGIEPANS